MLKRFWPSFLMLALLFLYIVFVWFQIETVYQPLPAAAPQTVNVSPKPVEVAPAPKAVNTSRQEIDLGETWIIPKELITQEKQP